MTQEQYEADIAALERQIAEMEIELAIQRRLLNAAYDEIDELLDRIEEMEDEE